MAYNPSIPGPNDNLSTSQGQIQNNFTQLNNLFNLDHVQYSDATDGGYHRKVTLINVAAPNPVAPASAVYSKTIGGVQELFFKNGIGQETQLTSIARPLWKGVSADSSVNASLGIVGVSLSSNGYLALPNGLIMQWGISNINNTGSPTTINFPITFGSAVYNITTSCFNNQSNSPSSNNVYIKDTPLNPALDSFIVTTSSSGGIAKIYWSAIGK